MVFSLYVKSLSALTYLLCIHTIYFSKYDRLTWPARLPFQQIKTLGYKLCGFSKLADFRQHYDFTIFFLNSGVRRVSKTWRSKKGSEARKIEGWLGKSWRGWWSSKVNKIIFSHNYFFPWKWPSINDITHLGEGVSAIRWRYTISLHGKMGDKGEE